MTENRWATIWGGASLLKMMMSCMSEMRKMKWNMDFLINLSESDYILKHPVALKAFLAKMRGKNFVKNHGRATTLEFIQRQGNSYYHMYMNTEIPRLVNLQLVQYLSVEIHKFHFIFTSCAT